jgi:hypothetical protein
MNSSIINVHVSSFFTFFYLIKLEFLIWVHSDLIVLPRLDQIAPKPIKFDKKLSISLLNYILNRLYPIPFEFDIMISTAWICLKTIVADDVYYNNGITQCSGLTVSYLGIYNPFKIPILNRI